MEQLRQRVEHSAMYEGSTELQQSWTLSKEVTLVTKSAVFIQFHSALNVTILMGAMTKYFNEHV